MRKIKQVKIWGFWGDKSITLNFNRDINFLIGVNGSGKTTIINLIAATLNADFATLDKAQFDNLRIDFFEEIADKSAETYIEVDKKNKEHSPYPNISFKIKSPTQKVKSFNLSELEEESIYRYNNEYRYSREYIYRHSKGFEVGKDINIALKELVNITWLSIHRTTGPNRNSDDKSFESSIDLKIKELASDLVKYFGILDRRYSYETEKFQKNIFLSLIEDELSDDILGISTELDPGTEKDSLKQIFQMFGLKEKEFDTKLAKHFKSFETAKKLVVNHEVIELKGISALLSTVRIHSIVKEWNLLNEMKIKINKPKSTFITEINQLFQRKEIIINDRNELLVETQSGKLFPLFNLSSGEKQLLIILGQSLLQENSNHIYIADEPELSLHVEWQEKLVSSLKNVNPNSQIIFATHSPDIVGGFSDAVIKVEDAIL